MKSLFIPLLLCLCSGAQAAGVLTILNWSDYLDPEVIEEFSAKYGVEVKQLYFESDDDRDRILIEAEGQHFDLILINDSVVNEYVKFGWIEPVTVEQVPNIKYIDPKWYEIHPGTRGYAIPFLWGTTGIVYNRRFYDKPVTSWRELFEPDEATSGKVMLVKSQYDVIGMALKYLGYSANSSDVQVYDEVEEVLLRLKDRLYGYSYTLDTESSLVKGDAVIAMAYSGDALALNELNPDLVYVIPMEGGGIWVDYFSIGKDAPNRDNAYKFLQFINKPEVAARVAQYGYYPTPNRAAEKLLPQAFRDNPGIYPPPDVLARSEYERGIAIETVRRRNTLFINLTAGWRGQR